MRSSAGFGCGPVRGARCRVVAFVNSRQRTPQQTKGCVSGLSTARWSCLVGGGSYGRSAIGDNRLHLRRQLFDQLGIVGK